MAKKLIADFAVEYCKAAKIQDDRVCEMGVKEFEDVVFYVLTKGDFTPAEMCGRFFSSICPPYHGPWWNVTIPQSSPKSDHKTQPLRDPNSSTLKFLMLTDIHVDFYYIVGAITDCGEPLCCRDLDAKAKERAGLYGHPQNCDANQNMVARLFEHLELIQDQFDYIIFTGDVPAHDVWNQTTLSNLVHVEYLDKMFSTYLPGKPVYYTAGNHEGLPVNTFPPPGIKEFTMDWLYGPITEIWGKWLDDKSKQTIRSCAKYSFSPYPGFRIISINTNYANSLNYFLMLNATDPCDTLQWMVDELEAAKNAGEKVHLLTHIPNESTLKPWSWNFYDIIIHYSDIISNIFNGHSHTDWYQVYYDLSTNKSVAHAWVGPSASGHTNLFPSYRIYTMDGNYPGSTWSVLDYDNYYLNITRANHEGIATFEHMYNVKTAYNMTGLTASDYDDLYHRLAKDDELFQLFYKHYNTMYPVKACDEKCKDKVLKHLIHSRK